MIVGTLNQFQNQQHLKLSDYEYVLYRCAYKQLLDSVYLQKWLEQILFLCHLLTVV